MYRPRRAITLAAAPRLLARRRQRAGLVIADDAGQLNDVADMPDAVLHHRDQP
ncbi:hypothetical protein [Sphingomonas rubra]|uniref:Uncharacterized protein n=1 Tax=Sphingomonas rubra TaxID=634430 RepID=A0A1I5U5L9_9SPHN|nr:hypothetical protein [Sphingomonas rubra]SFP90548.1 hypothetical protein SAMN04488241_110137 [Sphingomonas rubra]